MTAGCARPAVCAGFAATLLLALGSAPAAGPPPATLPSCAAGPPIVFAAGDSRVLLDAADRLQVLAAVLQRHPALQRDGFDAQHIVLWRRPGGDWVFVTLLQPPDAGLCFTATVAAAPFEITHTLVLKYFFEATRPS